MIPTNCNECSYVVSNKQQTSYKCSHESGWEIDEIFDPLHPIKECPLHDDELEAKRFKAVYRKESLYIVVSLKYGMPYEIFAEHPTNMDVNLYYMMSSLDTITRLCTMSLKKYPLQRVINQMVKSSRTKNDFPGIISKILLEWV